jgi:hypothetical protein
MDVYFEFLPRNYIALGIYVGPYFAEDIETGEMTCGHSLELSFLFFNIYFYF